jgi:hypothetical protein
MAPCPNAGLCRCQCGGCKDATSLGTHCRDHGTGCHLDCMERK